MNEKLTETCDCEKLKAFLAEFLELETTVGPAAFFTKFSELIDIAKIYLSKDEA